jgi:hypothetical protein
MGVVIYWPCDLPRMLTQAIDAYQKGGIFSSASGSKPRRSYEDEILFTNAFMNLDDNDSHGINSLMNVPLRDWFHLTRVSISCIYVKDEAYNSLVDLDIIAIVEKDKFFIGK